MTQATAIYRAIMLEVERQRIALGFPMEKFSEYAGVPERYYSKALHADQASGRQAQWSTLQIIVDALFPDGFDVTIAPKPGAVMTPESLKAKLLQLKATKDPKSQRELMRELGRAGRAQQIAKQSKKKRQAIARLAARARWRRHRRSISAQPVSRVLPSAARARSCSPDRPPSRT